MEVQLSVKEAICHPERDSQISSQNWKNGIDWIWQETQRAEKKKRKVTEKYNTTKEEGMRIHKVASV
jgi:hypothetical protein